MKAFVLVRGSIQGVQNQWGGAFADGLARHGISARLGRIFQPCDLLVCWGVRQFEALNAQKRAGGQIVILERGYLGDRFTWTSVSFGGGLNGRGEFRGTKSDPDRFERFHGHLMRPWRTPHDKTALLIGQVPGDMSLQGANMGAWYSKTVLALKAAGWHVLFREHPRAVERNLRIDLAGTERIAGTLGQALDRAGLVVTWNSNAAVDAVLAGVPAVTCDPGSMAWDVTSHAVAESAVMPDRREWAARLAWKQWREDEVRSGACWAAVGGSIQEVAA